MTPRTSLKYLLLMLLLIPAISVTSQQVFGHAALPFPNGRIDFFTAKNYVESSTFYPGDEVQLIAGSPSGTILAYIEVYLISPHGSYLIKPRALYTISGTVNVLSWTIPREASAGTYTFKISIWDSIGTFLGEVPLPFKVTTPFSPVPVPTTTALLPSEMLVPIVAAVGIIAAGVIAAALILRGKPPRPAPGPVPTGPISPGPISGPIISGSQEETIVRQQGTMTVEGGGGTVRLLALLSYDNMMIPVTQSPQNFGREDFARVVPPTLLNVISRRARPQFTIYYSYQDGCFYIEDRNSTNGTYLNGVDIRGRGPQPLRDGDTISIAGSINLRFTHRVLS